MKYERFNNSDVVDYNMLKGAIESSESMFKFIWTYSSYQY